MGYGHNFNNVRDSKCNPWTAVPSVCQCIAAKAHLFLRTFRGIGLWGTLNQVMKRFPLFYPLVFLVLPPKLAATLPTLLKANLTIVRDRITNRHSLKHPDYFSLLIQDNEPVPSEGFLVAQANHLIVGGFDPDTNLFTAAVHFLLTNPEKMEKLNREIRTTFASYEDIRNDALQSLPYLHAVIEETLRLHTNGAFGLPRISPGDTVDGHYIPAGVSAYSLILFVLNPRNFLSRCSSNGPHAPTLTSRQKTSGRTNPPNPLQCVVQTAAFATTHSARYFHHPRSFHPERWLPAEHAEYDPVFNADVKSAFKPFSMGPRGCVGQNMGYMQARILFAKMVYRFDWELVDRGVDWERDLRLYAIWEKPPVVVRYRVVGTAKE
ncbi:MAG: cytochrome P450 [Lasallia pustulata]|uniref:Cytochrome P450 n=1 Tax=Lasallia pustulata TaxID=136370 RepID=A0A5M8PD30_9LECA|nr:MAG: cytochrome P450 [Lasallia pustulata]